MHHKIKPNKVYKVYKGNAQYIKGKLMKRLQHYTLSTLALITQKQGSITDKKNKFDTQKRTKQYQTQ